MLDIFSSMASPPSSLPELFAGLRAALQAQTGELRPHGGALDGMLLTLLSLLLGPLERLARAWHPAPRREETVPEEYWPDLPACHSPMAFLPPSLRYLLGARRNRGMAPHARSTPLAPAPAARAPPPRAPARGIRPRARHAPAISAAAA